MCTCILCGCCAEDNDERSTNRNPGTKHDDQNEQKSIAVRDLSFPFVKHTTHTATKRRKWSLRSMTIRWLLPLPLPPLLPQLSRRPSAGFSMKVSVLLMMMMLLFAMRGEGDEAGAVCGAERYPTPCTRNHFCLVKKRASGVRALLSSCTVRSRIAVPFLLRFLFPVVNSALFSTPFGPLLNSATMLHRRTKSQPDCLLLRFFFAFCSSRLIMDGRLHIRTCTHPHMNSFTHRSRLVNY